MKKIIVLFALIVSLLITTVGCSNSSPSNEADAADTPVTEGQSGAEEPESGTQEEEDGEESADTDTQTGVGITEEDAKALVKEFYEEFILHIQNNDFQSFHKLYSTAIDESTVAQEFSQTSVLLERGRKENVEVELMFYTDDVIGASVLEYTNIFSGGQTNHSNIELKLYIEKINNEWQISYSDYVQEMHEKIFLSNIKEKYGEEYLENGYVNGNHPILFDKVVTNHVEVQVYRIKPNEEGSLDIDLAISNGLDNDVFEIKFKELTFRYGFDKIPFLTLKDYSLNNTHIVYSKDISIITLNFDKEDLLVPAEVIEFNYIELEQSISTRNRD